jgi:hypothetical protein
VGWAVHPPPNGDSELKNVGNAMTMLCSLNADIGMILTGVGGVLAGVNPQARWREPLAWRRCFRVGRLGLISLTASITVEQIVFFSSTPWGWNAIFLAVAALMLTGVITLGRIADAALGSTSRKAT